MHARSLVPLVSARDFGMTHTYWEERMRHPEARLVTVLPRECVIPKLGSRLCSTRMRHPEARRFFQPSEGSRAQHICKPRDAWPVTALAGCDCGRPRSSYQGMASAMPHRPQTICHSDRNRIIRSLNDSRGTWTRGHLCLHSGKYRGRAAIHGRVQRTGRFKRASARRGFPRFEDRKAWASLGAQRALSPASEVVGNVDNLVKIGLQTRLISPSDWT